MSILKSQKNNHVMYNLLNKNNGKSSYLSKYLIIFLCEYKNYCFPLHKLHTKYIEDTPLPHTVSIT